MTIQTLINYPIPGGVLFSGTQLIGKEEPNSNRDRILIYPTLIKQNAGVYNFVIGRQGHAMAPTDTRISREHLDVRVDINTGEVKVLDKGSKYGSIAIGDFNSYQLMPERIVNASFGGYHGNYNGNPAHSMELAANQDYKFPLTEKWSVSLSSAATLESTGDGTLSLKLNNSSNPEARASINFPLPSESVSPETANAASQSSLLAATQPVKPTET